MAHLLQYRVKMIVVACNSSSSYALSTLNKLFDLPIIGVIDPGAKKAVQMTKNKLVGVIATPATINSQSYTNKIKELDPTIHVVTQPCPLFVSLVEEGWFNNKAALLIAREYLKKMKKCKVDHLILGCTHYPLLKAVLKKVMGPAVTLIDSAQEVAAEVKAYLKKNGLEPRGPRTAQSRFLITDEPQHFQKLAKRFLGYSLTDVRRVQCGYPAPMEREAGSSAFPSADPWPGRQDPLGLSTPLV